MRSVADLLKTYNVVNTPEARKFTVRFFAGLLAVALGGAAVFWAASGPFAPTDDVLHAGGEDGDGDDTDDHAAEGLPLVIATPTATGVYIGFAPDAPVPETEDERHAYLYEAMQDWLQANAGATVLDVQRDPPAGHGALNGYYVTLLPAQPLLP